VIEGSKMNESSEQEEVALVCAACGCLMSIPRAELPDYYRGQRWVAGLGLALTLVYLALLT
jgi:hypothetical protein